MTPQPRPLSPGETRLLRLLLRRIRPQYATLPITFPERVIPLEDGGMGSFSFVYPEETPSHLPTLAIAEYPFPDQDGTPVLATLYARSNGRLHSLDIWKTDFSPLLAYPEIP
ncbi:MULTISPECIES: hypothetical protein [Eikenella]|uniref:DUF6984 domain-containing protein n=1 Tax=Eikenella longinqua TaxID=1795827 RepID=A0A1A9RWB1_9NEIS|nr:MULTISPECIES: hypothetical protein [Eikenella]OAM26753.1 hypothetical protein A7P95_08320 [Eikenella longinqua]